MRRFALAVVCVVLGLVPNACTSDKDDNVAKGYRRAPAAAGRAAYPETWKAPSEMPSSPGLRFVARGRPAAGCPTPVYVVRQADGETGTLEEAVVLFNELEQLRRPGRKVFEQRSVDVPGAKATTLVVADARPVGGSTRVVRTFDLLGLTDEGEAFHVAGSGCKEDLPRDFLDQAVLAFRPRATP